MAGGSSGRPVEGSKGGSFFAVSYSCKVLHGKILATSGFDSGKGWFGRGGGITAFMLMVSVRSRMTGVGRELCWKVKRETYNNTKPGKVPPQV